MTRGARSTLTGGERLFCCEELPMMPQPMPSMPPPDHESASRMTEEAAPETGPAAMKVDNVSIRPAENGGFIVSCSKSPVKPSNAGGGGWSSKDYAFSSIDEMLAYVAKEFGGGAPSVEPAGDDTGAAL